MWRVNITYSSSTKYMLDKVSQLPRTTQNEKKPHLVHAYKYNVRYIIPTFNKKK